MYRHSQSLQWHTAGATIVLGIDYGTALGFPFSLLQVTKNIFFCCACQAFSSIAAVIDIQLNYLFWWQNLGSLFPKREKKSGYPPENTISSFLFIRILFLTSIVKIHCCIVEFIWKKCLNPFCLYITGKVWLRFGVLFFSFFFSFWSKNELDWGCNVLHTLSFAFSWP